MSTKLLESQAAPPVRCDDVTHMDRGTNFVSATLKLQSRMRVVSSAAIVVGQDGLHGGAQIAQWARSAQQIRE